MIHLNLDLCASLASGVLRLFAAGFILMRQILLEPDRPNYPDGGHRQRWALFGFGVLLAYNGTDLLYRALTAPPRAAMVSGDALSFAMFVLFALELEGVMRSWLPERLQRRVQKWIALASCRNRDMLAAARAQSNAAVRTGAAGPTNPRGVGPALAELAMAGVQIIGPNEPPGAVDWHSPGGPL